MSQLPVIEVRDLTRNFGSFTAVDHVTFTVNKGEIFGFLGANGAGKTTVIRILCGLLSPTSGYGNVAGFDVYRDKNRIKARIGYMSQKFSLYPDLTARENMIFYGGIYGMWGKLLRRKVEELIESLEIRSFSDKKVKDLPAGWKQKIAFSTALIHDPEIVFLDEPTGGVDPLTRRQFWEMILQASERGITLLVTTHYMDEAEYCNRISIMVDGKIAALGTPEYLKESYSSLSIQDVFIRVARNSVRNE